MPRAIDRHPVAGSSRQSYLTSIRAKLADGAVTTVHVARYELARTQLVIRRLPGLAQLESWCAEAAIEEALVGGFYVRNPADAQHSGSPLGELWLDGERQLSLAFSEPWGRTRACVHSHDNTVRIARRDGLPSSPDGDLLQAGPLIVAEGRVVTGDDEGFSAGADQFDSDITIGRHPRAALGMNDSTLIAVACDGRAPDDAGLTISELAQLLKELGARDALNLDGGGSTSLVCGGRLANTPRESHGITVAGGRAIATAFVFAPR
ncbi:MAG TPA: phosphodiester glycosidase family protein [Baekduia sp.]|nr:phosphodiester glycosidase family protein [Baekduia sp.]